MDSKRVVICGDIHGNHLALNKRIEESKPEILINVGDFYYFESDNYSHKFIENINIKNTIIYFIDGNHDSQNDLNRYVKLYGRKNPIQVSKNIFYIPRGCVLNFNGKNILFIGGAKTPPELINPETWKYGFNYFPETESINRSDFEYIMDNVDEKIDIIISHTCPDFLYPTIKRQMNITLDNMDYSSKVLSEISKKFKPSKWYFGHFHSYFSENINDCEYTLLNMCSSLNGRSWVLL